MYVSLESGTNAIIQRIKPMFCIKLDLIFTITWNLNSLLYKSALISVLSNLNGASSVKYISARAKN
jgi:hypothetical protein